MKRIISCGIIALLLIGAYTAHGYSKKNSAGTVDEIVSGSVIAAGNVTSSAGYIASTVQSDTNVTTTATSYTPQFTGQILIGGAGTGTNGVWIAKGVTTNDWVVVAP